MTSCLNFKWYVCMLSGRPYWILKRIVGRTRNYVHFLCMMQTLVDCRIMYNIISYWHECLVPLMVPRGQKNRWFRHVHIDSNQKCVDLYWFAPSILLYIHVLAENYKIDGLAIIIDCSRYDMLFVIRIHLDSNQGLADLQSAALPTELYTQLIVA